MDYGICIVSLSPIIIFCCVEYNFSQGYIFVGVFTPRKLALLPSKVFTTNFHIYSMLYYFDDCG